MADAMEKRLRGLIRKADAHTPPELKTAAVRDGLISALATSISRKREYDDLFASSDAVAAWAASRGLPEQQTRLLQLMRRHKDIFIPNPILDAVLTAAFGAECVFVLWDLNTKHLVLLFIVLLLLADAVITRVKGLFTEWGRALSTWLFRRGFVESDPPSGRIQMKKWTDQSWQLFVHVLFAGMEAWILYEEPWYDNPATCWMPHVYSMRGRFREDLVVLYLAQLAVWVYTCIVHRFFDERRKDYFVLYVHHIVTIALVGVSFSAGYLRIGLIVLYVHDVSDVLVDMLKMVNYLKLENRRGLYLSELTYAACVTGWIYWRLYQFPFRVIRGSLIEAYQWMAPQPRAPDGLLGIFTIDMPLFTHTNTLLLVLLGLHIYWFYLFLMIGYRILTESAREASRQEYEGDSDDETEVAAAAAAAAAAGGKPAIAAAAAAPANAQAAGGGGSRVDAAASNGEAAVSGEAEAGATSNGGAHSSGKKPRGGGTGARR